MSRGNAWAAALLLALLATTAFAETLMDDGCFFSGGKTYCPVCIQYDADGFCSKYDNRVDPNKSPPPSSSELRLQKAPVGDDLSGPGVYGRYCFTSKIDGKLYCPKCTMLAGEVGQEYCAKFSYYVPRGSVPGKKPEVDDKSSTDCTPAQEQCADVSGLSLSEFKPCCPIPESATTAPSKSTTSEEVALECIDVDVLGPARYCVPATVGASNQCIPDLKRCAGAPNMPFIQHEPCCTKGYVCVEDASMGWGKFCKAP